ncbi:hypothetical protein WJX73_003554 [Symbiochloris irregularis]|uniref:PA domain-containing protein n=1 Tax=Symbiochloris irregularis TaxID=706552 RepID=A0AAW1NMF1_9CHLO
MTHMRAEQARDIAARGLGSAAVETGSRQGVQHFTCRMEVDDKSQAHCSSLEFMPLNTALEALPDNVAIVRVIPAFQQQNGGRGMVPLRLRVWDPENVSVALEALGGPPSFSWTRQEAVCANGGNSTDADCTTDDSLLAQGVLVRAEDALGCSADALRQQPALRNAIALLERGTCMFTDKVLNAEGAGAKAAIILDSGEGLHGMAGDGSGRQPSIPSVLLPASSGAQMLGLLRLAGAGQEDVSVKVELLFTPKSREWLSQQLPDPTDMSACMATMMSSILSQSIATSDSPAEQP